VRCTDWSNGVCVFLALSIDSMKRHSTVVTLAYGILLYRCKHAGEQNSFCSSQGLLVICLMCLHYPVTILV
jgi:hypothetical protein